MNETQQSALRSIALTVGIAVSCLAIVFISVNAAYPSVTATAKFLGYVLVFNLLPGLVVTRLVLPGAKEAGVFLIFSLGMGIATNVLVVTALWSIDQLYFLFLLPVLATGTAIARFRRSNFAEFCADWKAERNYLCWIIGTLFCCFTALLGVGFVFAGDFVDSYSMHLAFQGVILRGLEIGWPPPNLLLPGVAWSYNYAAHLWLLGVEFTTGLPVDVLVARYGPVFLGGASAALMAAFGRYVVGLAWWITTLPVICVYWVVGIPAITGAVFASFMPFAANQILSPFLAIVLFFLTLAFVLENPSVIHFGRFVRFAALVVLLFVATGARGVCPPILLCALALRLVAISWQRRKLSWEITIDLVAAIVGFGAGLRFFFTVGTGFSGAGALKFTGQPFSFLADANQTVLTLPHLLMGLGVAALPAGIAAFIVIAVFQAAFLTPALPTAFVEIRRRRRDADVLLIGCGIAGIAGFFLTEAPGLSHISFLYFSNISFSLLGAWGLQHIFCGVGQRHWRRFEPAALIAISLMTCLQLWQLPIKTVAWVGNQWSASAVSMLSSVPLPRWAVCMRDQDADLLARAGRISPAAVVIVVRTGSLCGPIWWVVRSPVQTLSDYMLTYVPGSATEPALHEKISAQQQHMIHALASAAQGILDVPDVIAMAETLADRGPIFVMAPRGLSVQADANLQKVDVGDSFALWQVHAFGRDHALSQPAR